MKAEDKHVHPTSHLAHHTPSVAENVSAVVHRVQSANVWVFRILGIVVVVAIIGLVWWLVARENTKAASEEWKNFLLGKGDGSSKYIKLEEARKQLGPDGIGQLQSRKPEMRDKGLENVEKARNDLAKLADEFKDDPSMKAACYLEAADAELTLVGYLKKGSTTDTRGTVSAAVELYRKAAAAIGANTDAGKTIEARAVQLESDPKAVKEASNKLSVQYAFAPNFGGEDGPKAPVGPLGPFSPFTPPVKPEEGPKAPEKPLELPVVAPPPIVPPTTPVPVPPPVVPPAVPPKTPPPTPDPNKK